MWLLIVHLYALVITWHWLRTAAPKIQDPTDSPALSSNEQSPSTAGPSKPNSPSEADGTNHGSTSQTTAQDTNPSIRATFNVRTFLLYGVLATSRSWLIGVRKLVRLEHAKMLAVKVAGPHLPQELVDAIVAELVALDAPIIEHKIATDDKAFAWNREDARASTPNEREVQRQIDTSDVVVNRLGDDDSFAPTLDLSHGGLVVLRASTSHTQPAIVPPTTTRKLRISPTPNVDGLYSHDDVFCVGDQAAIADCVPSTSAEAHQAHAHPGYDDARYITPCGKGVKRWGLRRLLLCGRLNEAMATWDHAAVERWKGKLGLETVKPPLYADDAMKPSLLVYQGLGTGI